MHKRLQHKISSQCKLWILGIYCCTVFIPCVVYTVILQHFVGHLSFLHFWNIDDSDTKKVSLWQNFIEFQVLLYMQYQVIFKTDSKNHNHE